MYVTILISLFLSFLTAQNDFIKSPLASSKTPYRNIVRLPREESLITGNVAVRRASNGNIIVIVDKSVNATKVSPDGIPDLVFRFAPLKDDLFRHMGVSFNLKQAQVFFQPGRLAVVTKNNQLAMSLSVEEIEKTDGKFPTYGDQSRDLPNAVRLHQGVGLVRQVPIIADTLKAVDFGKTPKAARLPTLVDLETDFVVRRGEARAIDDGGFEIEGCTSGGQGATSCSIDCPGGNGCGITCGIGYWACCKCPNNCQCTQKS
jgi:hypothetical protein